MLTRVKKFLTNAFRPTIPYAFVDGKLIINSDVNIVVNGSLTISSNSDVTILSGKWSGSEEGVIYLNSDGKIEQNIEIINEGCGEGCGCGSLNSGGDNKNHDCLCGCDGDCGSENDNGCDCGCKTS